ncbi:MAG: glutamate racemase [Elusimicrobiota bacterium]
MSSQLPIGVFDSGLGGLTVIKEIAKLLPSEDMIYVGDTARVPYGNKSPETIRRYALQIAFFLMQKRVKLIVVACNTASSLALKSLKNLPIPVLGVIEPGARAAALASAHLKIGVIGTSATVGSHAYLKNIRHYSPKAHVWEQACPLFVPLVEEGWLTDSITENIGKTYLKEILKHKIDTLVLGCTHYPLLKPMLQKISGPRIKLIDSAEETAKEVRRKLEKMRILNSNSKKGKIEYFVSDNPKGFSKLAKQFLNTDTISTRRFSLENL